MQVVNPSSNVTFVSPIQAGQFKRSPVCEFNGMLFFSNKYDTARGMELYKLDLPPDNIAAIAEKETVTIYPNPATDMIHIQADAAANITPYSLEGQKLLSTTSNTFSVGHLPSGLYLVEVRLRDGKKLYAKLVRQ
jgi:hypothetical protein